MSENKYLKAMQQASEHVSAPAAVETAEPTPRQSRMTGKVGRPPGKRSNPDWEQVTVFVKKNTKRAALRRIIDDQSPLDLSEVIEQLLSKWAKAS